MLVSVIDKAYILQLTFAYNTYGNTPLYANNFFIEY